MDEKLLVEENIQVQCTSCGGHHAIRGDLFYSDSFSEQEANMGTRTEHVLSAECNCPNCGASLRCSVYVSEYPPNCIEDTFVECSGCENIGSKHPAVCFEDQLYEEYGAYIHSKYFKALNNSSDNGDQITGFALDSGQAFIYPGQEGRRFPAGSRISIELPRATKLFNILVDETNVIRFEANKAVLADVISVRPKVSATNLLGKVAEAVVVRRCAQNDEINKIWLDKARRGRSRPDIAKRFVAIGTGLKSTKRDYPQKYNPTDSQRDIIWLDKQGNVANVIGSNAVSGIQAGLQIKVSGQGQSYVQPDITSRRYEVPLVYFPIHHDFPATVDSIRRHIGYEGFVVGEDLIDAEALDRSAFQEVCDYYPILLALYTGKISADDFVREATAFAPLKNAILSDVLRHTSANLLLIK